MVHTARSPGWYSFPSQGEPQMCRWAYGVAANIGEAVLGGAVEHVDQPG